MLVVREWLRVRAAQRILQSATETATPLGSKTHHEIDLRFQNRECQSAAVEKNGADGSSDIEGKATRVGARMEPRGASDIDGQNREVEMCGST
jgi:hypothetical protein